MSDIRPTGLDVQIRAPLDRSEPKTTVARSEAMAFESITHTAAERAGMSEDEDTEAESTVELGDGPDVAGQPIARVASRLTWPKPTSEVVVREGDVDIRTPDGPRALDDVLDAVDIDVFDSRVTFVEAIRDEVGRGPVATE